MITHYHSLYLFLPFHWPRAHHRVKMGYRFPEQAESDLTYLVDQKNGDRMIKQLLNSVIAKYCDLSVSRRSIICLRVLLRKIIDLLATDKSRHFAQAGSITV